VAELRLVVELAAMRAAGGTVTLAALGAGAGAGDGRSRGGA